jgi:hypothetical protein
MTTLPERTQQIIQSHAQLIHAVVHACQNRDSAAELEPLLEVATANGWTDLVPAIRRILGGDRNTSLLDGLDEEDHAIIDAILRGLQDPATLPDLSRSAEPEMAAPGLAYMIHSASTGDTNALQMLGSMAEQMNQAGGQMTRLGAAISRIMQGETDPDRLCEGMDTRGEKLVLEIVAELKRLRTH